MHALKGTLQLIEEDLSVYNTFSRARVLKTTTIYENKVMQNLRNVHFKITYTCINDVKDIHLRL